MSGSSNQEVKANKDFDACAHLDSLILETNVQVAPYIHVHYLPGWKKLVQDFVTEIAPYPIRITCFDDWQGVLSVRFSTMKRTKELVVWRAIDKWTQLSKRICMGCGAVARHADGYCKGMLLCTRCEKEAAKSGNTGTWLDEY